MQHNEADCSEAQVSAVLPEWTAKWGVYFGESACLVNDHKQ